MRKQIVLILALAVLAMGCGQTKVIDGVEYNTYGLLNQDQKNPNIAYQPIWGNIIWGAILFETAVAPIYFYGFSCFEPIGKKPAIVGQVPKP